MFQDMIAAGSGGSSESQDWIEAKSYPTHGVLFEWDFDADAVIIAFNFNGNYKNIMYIDMNSKSYIQRGNWYVTDGISSATAFSAKGITASVTNRSIQLTHSSYNFSNGYCFPLKDSTILP